LRNPHNFDQYSPITGIEKKSFASFTIRNRLPSILDRVIEDNDFDDHVNVALNDLKHHILHEKITNYLEKGNDRSSWKNWLKSMIGKTWFEIPFYFAEAYFYRIIMDKIDFYSWKIDPFFKQKRNDIVRNGGQFEAIIMDLQQFLHQSNGSGQIIKHLLFSCLWGNKSDLSQLLLNREKADEFHEKFALLDDSEKVSNLFLKQVGRVDVILDNSGMELFVDLLLSEKLISLNLAKKVVLHTKAFPTFVSDATGSDIELLVDFLKTQKNKNVQAFAKNFEVLLKSKSIQVMNHEFWNSPLHFYELPRDLFRELEKSDLVVFKGDANYRRIFGDREIGFDTCVDPLCNYLPAKAVAVRILKSELMVELQKKQIRNLNESDPDWLINGKYGVIQMINE